MKRVAAAELAAALVLVALQRALFAHFQLRERLLDYYRGAAEHLNRGEITLLSIQLGLGIPACLLLADALARVLVARSLASLVEGRPRRFAAVAACFCATAAALVAWKVLGYTALTDDERVYLFEARSLLAGGITSIAPLPRAAFANQFVVFVGPDRWGGIFPPGQPALLALGLLFGHAHLTQYLCAAAIVWTVARFAEEEWGARASVLSAALLATSPALIFTAATLHNVVPSALCVAVAVRSSARVARGEPSLAGLAIGAAAGFAFLCRPLDGVLIALWSAGYLALTRGRSAVRPLLLAVAAGLPFLLIQLATYRALTGSFTTSPYEVWLRKDWPNARLFGFGPTVWRYTHTPRVALDKTVAALARVSLWAFGWPISIAGAVAMAFGWARDRTARALLVLGGLHLTGYFFYALGSVHDLGSYYHLFSLPLLAAITARVLTEVEERNPRFVHLAAAASVFGALTFVPSQVTRLRYHTARVRASLVVGERVARDGRVVIFAKATAPTSSWVYANPLPSPRADDNQVLWLPPTSREGMLAVAREHGDRRPYVLRWIGAEPVLEPL